MNFCVVLLLCGGYLCAAQTNPEYNVLKKMFHLCDNKEDYWKCFKVQVLKVAERAVQSNSINLFSGVTLEGTHESERTFVTPFSLKENALEKMDSRKLDDLILNTFDLFLRTHRVQVNFPKLIEESRKKKDNKQMGLIAAALAIKGVFLAMSYGSISLMAITAILVGKIALSLTAILGLKKLISSGNPQKTNIEIVKHPVHAQTHAYTNSHYEEEPEEPHYRRTSNNDFAQELAYNGYLQGKT